MVRALKITFDNTGRRFSRRRGARADRGGDRRQGNFRNNIDGYAFNIDRRREQGGTSKQKNIDNWTRQVFPGSHNLAAAREIVQNHGGTSLIVSNLHFNVTDRDMQVLFGEFGHIRRAAVHYDKSGKSLGSGEVIFSRRIDAIKAMEQYNGALLDGLAINLQLTTSEIPSMGGIVSGGNNKFKHRHILEDKERSTKGTPIPIRRNRANENVQHRRILQAKGGPIKGRRGQNIKTKKRKQPTAEELDAELDAYFQNAVKREEIEK